ncbi:hypothetical protein GF351_00490 [Candidatus Woesearchaeota archaeon]|nr:hypothetical protein [Candidatus Woesearchaeota archaeon]
MQACPDNMMIGLENDPPIFDSDTTGTLFGQAYEHLEERIAQGGCFVLDTAHAAMSVYHRHIQKTGQKIPSMEEIDEENNPSLVSLPDFIRLAGKSAGWIHVCDARPADNGSLSSFFEGSYLGIEKSMIPNCCDLSKGQTSDAWREVFRAVREHVPEPRIVLEIGLAHLDYGLVKRSVEFLKKIEII